MVSREVHTPLNVVEVSYTKHRKLQLLNAHLLNSGRHCTVPSHNVHAYHKYA